ncbi:MAG: hypothetical protein A3C15_01350 [Candidatus Magasanikbacteria bacterium RIFCSPHIGHO2_02_FULL_50_9b]|uniref:Glycosyltransferase 2-like domain-containing protein n=1 Tax=Candidatus Magasanikbacteria bacterium RIFCSPHIGHO2_02_FULL_50_9b TaxID=1798682 RepID=A0A1F6M7S6_9BACT|nr:MAG: hypothetical protein A3C15_01350 [Candidatus Magasanikbacteria bacterium RIFCSPHIGHO2_02_FULL_50_9b]
MSDAVDLSIITVGFKSREYVRALLESLFEARGDLSIEYFILDNASDDGLIEMVQKEFIPRADERLKIFAIQNSENLGFAKANNIGIKQARGRYILLLNPDMRLSKDTLTRMVEWMDNNKQAAIAGCKLIGQNGEIVPQVRRFPAIKDQLAILLKIPHLFPRVLDDYLATDFNYESRTRADSIRGSFFMIRRELIEKIGGLDERYFIWFEEVDYCKQAATAGVEVWYTNAATCTDYVGRSFSLVGGYAKQKYFTDSMVKYFAKWHPRAAWIFRLLQPLALAGARLKEKIKL